MVLDDIEGDDVKLAEKDAEGREEEDKLLEFPAKISFLIAIIIDSILRRASLVGFDAGFKIFLLSPG